MFRSGLSSKHVFVFVFLTNMQVNLACQTSFSLAVFGKIFFFHTTRVQILSKNYLHFYPPELLTLIFIEKKEKLQGSIFGIHI